MADRIVYAICDDDCRFPTMTAEQILAAIEQALEQGYVSDPDSAVFSKIKEICANGSVQLWVGTEAQFNALNPAPEYGRATVRVGADGVLYLCSDEALFEDISGHMDRKDNPHEVTFEQVIGSDAVPIENGGTNAKDKATARENLQVPRYVKYSNNLSFGSGTGSAWATYADDEGTTLNQMDLGSGDTTFKKPVNVKSGGTGATTADGAIANIIAGRVINPSRIKLTGYQYFVDGNHGFDANNSDIINANGIYFADDCNAAGEGINFYNSASTWDRVYASGGKLYFSPNCELGEVGTKYTVYHSGGDAVPVTKGGTGATDQAGLQKRVFTTQTLSETDNILTLDNGHYNRDGAVSKTYGWPYDSNDTKANVYVQGNRNGDYGYWTIFIVTLNSGTIYMNTHYWDAWMGWKKITTTDVTG